MAKSAIRYVCSSCGHTEPKWTGRCPDCGGWNTFEEEAVTASVKAGTKPSEPVQKLSDIPFESSYRTSSGMDELDRVLGGGIMRPSAVLVGGEPGIGKSTIMIQLLSNLGADSKVLYVSGEESPSQVRARADRMKLNTKGISICSDMRLEQLSQTIGNMKPGYIVIDSLQTLHSTAIDSYAGSPTQIKACCMELATLCKRLGSAVFFIAHVTKEGNIAGPKIVEHMVDTVLYFETAETGLRLLRAAKNRFGSVDEIGLFSMDAEGLHGVKDPSRIFVSSREGGTLPAGIAFTPVIEGSRVFLVEVQALVVPAKTGLQRIYSDRIDSARVSRVAAILQRHAGLELQDQDIYVNVAGGIRLTEVSIDLALALALYSSKADRPLREDLASFGELSLAGEVRPVAFADRRARCLAEMGARKLLCSGLEPPGGIKVVKVRDIRTALIAALGGKE